MTDRNSFGAELNNYDNDVTNRSAPKHILHCIIRSVTEANIYSFVTVQTNISYQVSLVQLALDPSLDANIHAPIISLYFRKQVTWKLHVSRNYAQNAIKLHIADQYCSMVLAPRLYCRFRRLMRCSKWRYLRFRDGGCVPISTRLAAIRISRSSSFSMRMTTHIDCLCRSHFSAKRLWYPSKLKHEFHRIIFKQAVCRRNECYLTTWLHIVGSRPTYGIRTYDHNHAGP